jgi:hypothetical protein
VLALALQCNPLRAAGCGPLQPVIHRLRGPVRIIAVFDGVWTYLGAPVSRQVPPVPAL